MRSVERIQYIHFLVSEIYFFRLLPLLGMAETAITGWLAELRSLVSFLKEGTPSRQWPWSACGSYFTSFMGASPKLHGLAASSSC